MQIKEKDMKIQDCERQLIHGPSGQQMAVLDQCEKNLNFTNFSLAQAKKDADKATFDAAEAIKFKKQLSNQFELPYTMTINSFEEGQQVKFTVEDIAFAKTTLVDAFQTQPSLFYVSVYVTGQLREREGGNWLCNINPAPIEDGLGYHDYKYLHLAFTRNGMKYWISIAKTSMM